MNRDLSTGLSVTTAPVFFMLVVLLSACQTSQDRYIAEARVFAPGVVSLPDSNIYRGSFSPDGTEFYFFRKVTPGQEDFRIYVSALTDDDWQAPVRVDLGGDVSDLYPTISPDGQRLVFTSYRDAPSDTSSYPNANLWYSERSANGWSEPIFMERASTLSNYDAGPRFDTNGAIHFVSTEPDWRTAHQYVVAWDGNSYTDPMEDASLDEWRTWRDDMFVWSSTISPDSSFLLLDVSPILEDGRRGPTDQWVTERTGQGWSEPRLLEGGVNTEEAYENFVVISNDSDTIFFVRGFNQYYEVSTRAALGN